jgi:hypothetical protein
LLLLQYLHLMALPMGLDLQHIHNLLHQQLHPKKELLCLMEACS